MDNALKKIEINLDMGETLGRWRLGPDSDADMMPLLDAGNIAAGFHASDPSTLRQTVQLAKKHGKQCGAHPGFPDLVGFGRRRMELSAQEVADIIVYQVGAVKGFCDVEGIPLTHVKPHGALYFYLLSSEEICRAAVKAVKAFNVPFYGLPGTLHETVCNAEGVAFVPEVFVDIEYTPEGALIPPAKSKHIDPAESAARAVSPFLEGTILAQSSSTPASMPLKGRPYSICLHSDLPHAVERLKEVRKKVDEINAKHFS
ncbi:unnamed protein product [Parajaminaea phylloscopi]